jgi:hypothetical protein
MRRRLSVQLALTAVLAVPQVAAVLTARASDTSATAATTRLVSRSSDGSMGNRASLDPDISGDGRYVVFQSRVSDLVAGDDNGRYDIFVKDRETGAIEVVSVTDQGEVGNDSSLDPQISTTGRYVVFSSMATNLDPADKEPLSDIYLHDRDTHATELVSGTPPGHLDQESYRADVTPDGRYIVFGSNGDPSGDDTNPYADVFVRDREIDRTELISVSSDEVQSDDWTFDGSISDDGRFVTFYTLSDKLVEGDTNEREDVFLRDREQGTTERISLANSGKQGNSGSVSAWLSTDGRFVLFESLATNLTRRTDNNRTLDLFLYDRDVERVRVVSLNRSGTTGNYTSGQGHITADGRYISFGSLASDLVRNDTNNEWDIFVRDMSLGKTIRVKVTNRGREAEGRSRRFPDTFFNSISLDGRFVTFESGAHNLVRNDTNDLPDIFVRGPLISLAHTLTNDVLQTTAWAIFGQRDPDTTRRVLAAPAL